MVKSTGLKKKICRFNISTGSNFKNLVIHSIKEIQNIELSW